MMQSSERAPILGVMTATVDGTQVLVSWIGRPAKQAIVDFVKSATTLLGS